MTTKFTTREFIDHRVLGRFMDHAQAAVTVVAIHSTSSGTFVLFSNDDIDAMAALDLPEFDHQGPGRGFSIDPEIPDNLVQRIDIKTGAVTPVDGFVPAKDGKPATTQAQLDAIEAQKAKDAKIAAIEALLDEARRS